MWHVFRKGCRATDDTTHIPGYSYSLRYTSFSPCLDIERTELVRGAAPSSQAGPVHSTGVYCGSQITKLALTLCFTPSVRVEYLSSFVREFRVWTAMDRVRASSSVILWIGK